MDDSRLISFTQTILRERSFSGMEAGVVEKIAAEMRDLKFNRVWVDEYGSVIGIIEGNLPGPTLLFDGHCDVVPAIPPDWKHDPFGAEIENDCLYGRGAADMKGALAAMIHAAASTDRGRMAGRIAVSATTLEELVEGGTLAPIMEEVQPDYVVIGEATNFNLNQGGRGRAEIVIETFGRSAHSSSPQAGLCAVHEMLKVIAAVEAMPMPTHPLIGQGQITLTDILSEPYPGHSVIPNRCRVTYDRRLMPGETPQSVLDSLRALPCLDGVEYRVSIFEGEDKACTGQTLHGQKFFPAWVFDESHPLVQAARRGLQNVGIDPQMGAYQFCTNAAHSAGIARVPTVGFGPCRETDAHTVDEHIHLTDLNRAARGYLGIIEAILYKR